MSLTNNDVMDIERSQDGVIYYWKNYMLHREDGPSIEYPDGKGLFYINGRKYIEEDYHLKIALLKSKGKI